MFKMRRNTLYQMLHDACSLLKCFDNFDLVIKMFKWVFKKKFNFDYSDQ
jgi:hypothetical protein